MLIGPFTPGFVGDSGLASELAEIGVILLMFGVVMPERELGLSLLEYTLLSVGVPDEQVQTALTEILATVRTEES